MALYGSLLKSNERDALPLLFLKEQLEQNGWITLFTSWHKSDSLFLIVGKLKTGLK